MTLRSRKDAPVPVNHERQKQARDQKEIRHPEWLCEGDQQMHETGMAGGGLDAQHRMHHDHHDDADTLGVVHPIDARRHWLRRRRGRTIRINGRYALLCHSSPLKILFGLGLSSCLGLTCLARIGSGLYCRRYAFQMPYDLRKCVFLSLL